MAIGRHRPAARWKKKEGRKGGPSPKTAGSKRLHRPNPLRPGAWLWRSWPAQRRKRGEGEGKKRKVGSRGFKFAFRPGLRRDAGLGMSEEGGEGTRKKNLYPAGERYDTKADVTVNDVKV